MVVVYTRIDLLQGNSHGADNYPNVRTTDQLSQE